MIYNKQTLFMDFAPSFNFELDEEQLLALALERGFIKEIGPDQYQMNEDYTGEERQ